MRTHFAPKSFCAQIALRPNVGFRVWPHSEFLTAPKADTLSTLPFERLFCIDIYKKRSLALIYCVSDDHAQVSSKKQISLLILLFTMVEKLNRLSITTHTYIFGYSESEPCSCSGVRGSCRYGSHEVDVDDFYHALKNLHTNVPECSQEPYLLCGYVLPHRPWR